MHYGDADYVTFLVNNRTTAATGKYRRGNLDALDPLARSLELPRGTHLSPRKFPIRASGATHYSDCLAFDRHRVGELQDGSVCLGYFQLQQSQIISLIDCHHVAYCGGFAIKGLEANSSRALYHVQISYDTICGYEESASLEEWLTFPVYRRNNHYRSLE
jgi:hypothetical protein